MLRRLRIENFMAHADTEIEFAPGVTVITGPNNTGKSAVVEALRCVVTNPSPRHFIRHGAKEARVELELDNGARISWVRKDRYALYEVLRPGEDEPETYAKFGRTPPEDVLALLGLSPVVVEEANNAEVDVHLGDQREPIFLLNRPGTVMAGFFAASSEAAHLLSMQQKLRGRVLRTRQEKRAVEERIERIEHGLDRLAPLPSLELALLNARETAVAVGKAERELPQLADAARRLRADRLAVKDLRQRLAALAPLQPAPPLKDTATLAGLLDSGNRLRMAEHRATAEARALAPLVPPPTAHETCNLASLVQTLRRLGNASTASQGKARVLAPLAPPPSLHTTGGMARDMDALRSLVARKAVLVRARDAVAALQPPPEPKHIAPLAELAEALRTGGKQVANARDTVRSMNRELADAHKSVADRLRQIGACPLCGGALDAESFLGGAHTHGNAGEAS